MKKYKTRGELPSMSNNELVAYIRENHFGQTLTQFNGFRVDKIARKRGLMPLLIEEGIIIRKKDYRLYTTRSDDQLIELARRNSSGSNIRTFIQENPGLYDEVNKRKILDKLEQEGILVRGRRKDGVLKNKSDEEFVNYIKDKYQGETITAVARKDSIAYSEIQRRGLKVMFFEEGVLKDNRSPWRDEEYTLQEAKTIMGYEKWDILPSDGRLRTLGYKRLSTAMNRYHGGINDFREKLMKYMGRPSEDSQLEEMLQQYAGGKV